MKRFLLLAMTALMVSCTTKTDYGQCVGVSENRNPKMEYKLSKWNTFVGVVLSGFIVPPILIFGEVLYCPVGPVRYQNQ